MSNFCPDTRGWWWSLFKAHLFSCAVGREGCCKQISLASVGSARSVSATLGCPRLQRVCFPCVHRLGSRLLCWELFQAGPGLNALKRSKLLRFRYSGTPQRRRLGWACVLGLRFVPFPGPSGSGDQVFGECGCCDLLPPRSLPLGFLGVQPAHLLRWMLTVQNPKKSWLATKPACSLVDNASLGP